MKQTIVVLDVETTGLNMLADEIIEFGAWRIEEGKDPVSLHFMVRPRRPVPGKILHLTGITEQELQAASPFNFYQERVEDFLRDAVLVGHNVQFDLGFLGQVLGHPFYQEVWDTLELARIFFPSLKQYSLSFLAEKLQLNRDNLSLHRALSDAYLSWKLLEKCWEKGKNFDLSLYDQAQPLLSNWEGRGFFDGLRKEIIRAFPARPIRTGLVLADGEEGLFNYGGSEEEKFPDQALWVKECFAEGGLLESQLKGYESRSGQIEMAAEIADSLIQSQNIVIEAGTGTGKSMAYLIPVLWWAKKMRRKIIVATHTIPLQEQLFQKDLPKLQNILPFSFKAALLKGRGNYFCLKRWRTLSNNPDHLNLGEKLALLSVLIWVRETLSGDLQELPQGQERVSFWMRLNTEEELCIPSQCSYATQCFLLRARKKAEEAQLVVINHSLLFSDLKTGFNVLPEYHHLIVDEAHHFYNSALEQLGVSLNREGLQRLTEMIYRAQGVSLYGNVRHRLSRMEEESPLIAWELFKNDLDTLPGLCRALNEQGEELFQLFVGIAGDSISFRLTNQHKNSPWWSSMVAQVENMAGRTKELLRCLGNLIAAVGQEDGEIIEALKAEINSYRQELEGIVEILKLILDVDNRERVVWLERSPSITIKSSAVDVSGILQEKVFSRLASSVLTSATLTVSGGFEHFLSDMGLEKNTRTLLVDSPFDYNEQMRLLVVKHLFSGQGENSMVEPLARFISAAAKRMEGRTLVLFTSHRLLQMTYPILQEKLHEENLDILGQGIDGSRKGLLEEFQRNPRSVLLGANSFWEGIDIPGAGLSCVILVKLPFWPPSLPLIEARSELLTAQGKNPFQDLMLPEAIIRFKQGFGRLIRTKEDRGVVILLDERAVEKSYGRLFFASLPIDTHFRGDTQAILKKLEDWNDENR